MGKEVRQTTTGGRGASTVFMPGDFALAVGMPPDLAAPDGWQWTKLTDVARMESGHTPSRRHPEYWGGDIPWVGIKDAKLHHGGYIFETLGYTNELGIANSSARILPKDTVCLSRTASVGYVLVLGREMATSQDFVNWICGNRIDPHFLKYTLLAEKEALLRFAAGAVHKTIYYPEAKGLHICLPPLPEQKRIVAILDEAFAAIATATTNAETNLANARELFESHLTAVFSRVPSTWGAQQLSETTVADTPITYGVVKPGPEGEVPFVRGGDVSHGRIRVDALRTISKEVSWQYRRTLLRGGELLVSLVGQPGQSAVVPPSLAGANIARQVGLIRLRPEFDPHFVCLFLRSSVGQKALGAQQSGSVQQVINLRDLKPVVVPLPSLPEQAKLVGALSDFEEMTERLRSARDKQIALLAELKQSTLHKAFTGELTAEQPADGFLFAGAETTDDRHLYAGVLALAYERHAKRRTLQTLGEIKREKIVHMVEAHCGIDLGRSPVKHAAGPADLARKDAVEQYARAERYFTIEREGKAKLMVPGDRFNELVTDCGKMLAERVREVESLVDLFVSDRFRRIEVVATAYAAWNNLRLDGIEASDAQIIHEGRENWHPEKMKIKPEEFRIALNWMRQHRIVPRGVGQRVTVREARP